MSATSQASNVVVTANAEFAQISVVKQGTSVDECTGTTIYAKSLYVQGQVSINPSLPDGASDSSVAGVAGNAFPGNLVNFNYAKSKNVRIVVLLDRAPNATVPKISDVYKLDSKPPIIKNVTHADLADITATPTIMLDPNKTRRFKVLYNEIVTVTPNDPCQHYEKYIPLNFYITYAGNSVAPVATHLITNGVYVIAFTEPEPEITAQTSSIPYWTYIAKMRFEP